MSYIKPVEYSNYIANLLSEGIEDQAPEMEATKTVSVKEAIKNVARKTGVSESVIKTILEHEYEKINKRVDLMMAAGLVAEVKNNLANRACYALKTVGYKEIFDMLDGQTSLEQSVEAIKQNTRRSMKPERLSVVHCHPMRIQLGCGIRAAGIKWCGLTLHGLLNETVHFAGRGLIKASLFVGHSNGLQHIQSAHTRDLCGQDGLVPRSAHKALRAQVVHLIGLHFLQNAREVGRVSQVAVVQLEAGVVNVRVLVNVVNALGVE